MNYSYRSSPTGERFIPVLNRDCFDQTDSVKYYDNYLDIKLTAKDTLTIVIGSDSGLLYKYLLTKDVPSGSHIAIIEHADVFDIVDAECQHWLSQQSDIHVSTGISLLCADTWESSLFDGNDEAWFLAGDIKLAQAQCAIADYQNLYYRLYRETKEAISERTYHIRKNYSLKVFTKVQMINCIDNHLPMKANDGFGKNRVAIVLGGGPSLDDHLEWIIANRSFLFIIAVYRLCTKLHKLDLYPDIVVAIDPYTVTFEAGRHGTQWGDIPLVHSYHVTPLLLQQWSGPCFYLGSRYPWDALSGKDINNIPALGPTVGHTATVLAFHLGFTKILLSGVDLCMNAQGDSHTVGSPEAELLKLPGYYEVQVTTYAGTQAGTALNFSRSIAELDKIGQQVNKHKDILFNLNKYAAVVPSIKYMDKSQVELKALKPELNIEEYSEQTLSDLSQLRKQMAKYLSEFRKIHDICEKALKCVDSMYKTDSNELDQVQNKRLDILESRLQKVAPIMLKCIRMYMSREFSKLRKPSGYSEMDQTELAQCARDYYKITSIGCKYFRNSLSAALKVINIREAELAIKPDIDFLLKTWEDNNTRGRILKFYTRLAKHASREQLEKLDAAKEYYIDSLSGETRGHYDHIRTRSGSIAKTMQSLRYLRDKKALTDLSTYAEKVKDMAWPYDSIANYINASVAELNGDSIKAIEQYKSVVDDCGVKLSEGSDKVETITILAEESLTNLTRLFVDNKDGESAISTLGTLCELSPEYIPSYANLLDITGNNEAAIEVLKVYLDYATFDWRAARQLAKIYEKSGNSVESLKAHELADRIRQESGIIDKAA